jgi:hypothetical protein
MLPNRVACMLEASLERQYLVAEQKAQMEQ